jgi:hypothetical protein
MAFPQGIHVNSTAGLVLAASSLALAACGTSYGSSHPKFNGTNGGTWEIRADLFSSYACSGFSEIGATGTSGFYDLHGPDFSVYVPAPEAWNGALAPIGFNAGCAASPARIGNDLYVILNGAVHQYAIDRDAWTQPVGSGLRDTQYSMSVSDDDGNVYSVVSDGSSANQLVRFASKTGAVDYIAGSAAWRVGEARLAWEPSTKKIYLAPLFNGPDFYSVVPRTGAISTLASPPGSGVGDAFCGDKSGHIYAQGGDGCNGTTMYRYDIAHDSWTALPDLPFPSRCAGSCAVTADGWLYVTDGGGQLARLKLY